MSFQQTLYYRPKISQASLLFIPLVLIDIAYCRKCLENNVRQTISGSSHGRRLSVYAGRRSSLPDNAALRDRMNRVQKELDHERQRNIALYQAFLPKDAIDHLYKDGVPVGGNTITKTNSTIVNNYVFFLKVALMFYMYKVCKSIVF